MVLQLYPLEHRTEEAVTYLWRLHPHAGEMGLEGGAALGTVPLSSSHQRGPSNVLPPLICLGSALLQRYA